MCKYDTKGIIAADRARKATISAWQKANGAASTFTASCCAGLRRTLTLGWSAYCAVSPPSTAIAHPVTNDALSEHSQSAASAISSGLPLRPMGSIATSR